MPEEIDIWEKIAPKEAYILSIRDGFLEVIENHEGTAIFRRIEIPWEQQKNQPSTA